MAEKIEIDVIANNLASTTLDLIKNKLMAVGGSTAMVGTLALTAGAAVVVGLSKAKDAAQAYDQQVYNLMLRTGGTADETSRLIQVIDDTGIAYSTLETAMKFAVKNGIEPNIESLAQLSDEYLALNPGVERGQFLLDKFGRSGMDMTRAMDLGGDALRRMGEEMKGGLILTEQNIEASEEYRKNVDKLKDSWGGFVTTIGNKVIPALNDVFDAMEEGQKNAIDRQIAWNQLRAEGMVYYDAEAVDLRVLKNRHEEWANSVDNTSGALMSMGDAADRASTRTDDLALSIEAAEKAQQNLLNQTITLTADINEYETSLADLNTTREDEVKLLDELVDKYGDTSQKVKDQKGKIAELDGQIDELKTSQEEQMNSFVLSMLQQKGATVEMQTAFALAAGLIDEETYNMVNAVNGVADAIINTGNKTGASSDLMVSAFNSVTGRVTAMKVATEKTKDDMVAAVIDVTDEIRELGERTRITKDDVVATYNRIKDIDGVESTATIYIDVVGEVPKIPTGPGSCFVSDTLVTMADGTKKPIELVQVGEFVLSFDTDNRVFVTAKIEDVLHHEAQEIDGYWLINGIGVTPDHLMFVNGGWKAAEDVEIGDVLLHEYEAAESVTSKRWISGQVPTYNLHTDHETHNYFAGGVLVHNAKRAKGGPVTAGEPYLVGEEGMEIFTPNQSGYIVPNNKIKNAVLEKGDMPQMVSRSAGQVINLNLYYSPMVSGFDRNELSQKLLPFIKDGLRQIRLGA